MKIYFADSIRAGRDDVEHFRYTYDRDLKWLLNSDVIVAAVTISSLGIGYEIGIAVKEKISVIALLGITQKRNCL